MESTPLETTLVFGLRYLEEEDLELNDIAGCNMLPDPPPESTLYMTGCDNFDSD